MLADFEAASPLIVIPSSEFCGVAAIACSGSRLTVSKRSRENLPSILFSFGRHRVGPPCRVRVPLLSERKHFAALRMSAKQYLAAVERNKVQLMICGQVKPLQKAYFVIWKLHRPGLLPLHQRRKRNGL